MPQQLQRQQRRAAHVAEAGEREDKAVLLRPLPRLQHGESILKADIQGARSIRAHKTGQFAGDRFDRRQAADSFLFGKLGQIADVKQPA